VGPEAHLGRAQSSFSPFQCQSRETPKKGPIEAGFFAFWGTFPLTPKGKVLEFRHDLTRQASSHLNLPSLNSLKPAGRRLLRKGSGDLISFSSLKVKSGGN